MCAVAAFGSAALPIAVDFPARRVSLLDAAGASFREPFFYETVERIERERDRSPFQIDLPAFLASAEHYSAGPDGIIFHLGRCGSTLLTNILGASGQHVVLREPDPVSHLAAAWLHAGGAARRREIESALAASVRWLLGVAGELTASRYRILKLAAWNVRVGPALLSLFPSAPAVFVYRSPLETVASLLYDAPGWQRLLERPRAVQVAFFPSLREEPEGDLEPAVVYAHAWRSAAEAALALPADRTCFVDYAALVADTRSVIAGVLGHFHQPAEPERLERMLAACAIYSKDPNGVAAFRPSSQHSRPALSASQGEAVRAITAAAWERLQDRGGAPPR